MVESKECGNISWISPYDLFDKGVGWGWLSAGGDDDLAGSNCNDRTSLGYTPYVVRSLRIVGIKVTAA